MDFHVASLLFLVLLCVSDSTGGVKGSVGSLIAQYNNLQQTETPSPTDNANENGPQNSQPYIDIAASAQNVTALLGKSAFLSCRVRNLGNKTVSWIRHRDVHILTVGGYTYTSDNRFHATYHQENGEWTLSIKWCTARDAGMYECQISTQPITSFYVLLNVVAPTALILGGPDLHVDKGSTINLTCTVHFSPEPPAYIFWYHEDNVISYDSKRGGVSVITEKGESTTSYLLIQHANEFDSGNYSCCPSNADIAFVNVHVLNGESPAAMQTGSAGFSRNYVTMGLIVSVGYTLSVCYVRFQVDSMRGVVQR